MRVQVTEQKKRADLNFLKNLKDKNPSKVIVARKSGCIGRI